MSADATPASGDMPDPWVGELAERSDGPAVRTVAQELAAHAPASYRESTPPAEAAMDAVELAALIAAQGSAPPTSPVRFAVRPGTAGHFHIRRFAASPIDLTRLLPLIESFGLVVEESVPHHLMVGSTKVSVDDVTVRVLPTTGPPFGPFEAAQDGPRLIEALGATSAGRADVDALNGLVTTAALTWRETTVLRAYVRYFAQFATVVPASDLEESLLAYPRAARALLDRFAGRFDPDHSVDEASAVNALETELATVPVLRIDRGLRTCRALIDATLRTNYYRPVPAGAPPVPLAFKIDSALVPDLPSPRPFAEIWVHAPQVEGIHLRAGPVARGGLRWSDRPDDVRTEVLDLMVAQVKKNAAIVPTGAKGGFIVRHVHHPGPSDVAAAYEPFVRALLDVTDNVVDGEVVSPLRVVARDGQDPYLVVAADRGTAELSDLANDISAEYRFWLGDAFASGGSHGYNHKAMGITARGAWVAVRRHFHQLGIDVQREPITVIGVGDMSGDVFGNGMLCSDTIRLVAAFDHRHVFIDPDPDPAASFAERRRMAALPTSSWADYDPTVISAGGGVWPRDAKSVPLSDSARRVLGVDSEQLTPPRLVTAILEAPTDLLWLAGIGTFVKADGESDAEVADHANDEVRTTAERLRVRVVAEGGNLGVTQRGRIRYSRRGGRINTDFIDNAAGVATSDREVNLKILCAQASALRRLDLAGRDALLAGAEPEVAADVLGQVDHSVSALNRAVAESAGDLDAYAALIDGLEGVGLLDRKVEALPDAEELAVRRAAGAGLARPELAVVLAYATSELVGAVRDAPLASEPVMADTVAGYFPADLRRQYGDLIPGHRLYVPILATEVAGEMVSHLGIVWAHETAAELGCSLGDVAAAYWAARQVTGAAQVWASLDERWSSLDADAEIRLRRAVADAVAGLARAYLRRSRPVAAGATITEDLPLAAELAGELAAPPSGTGTVESELGAAAAVVARRAAVGEVGPVVRRSGRRPNDAALALQLVDAAAGLAVMEAALLRDPPTDRWRAWLGRALLDDVAAWRTAAATDALAAGSEDVAGAVAAWAAAIGPALSAARRVVSSLKPGQDPLTVVAVAVRRLAPVETS